MIGRVVAAASLVLIAFATLRPEAAPPLTTGLCIICGSLGSVDAILNLLLFVPLGIGFALSGFTGRRAVLIVVGLSALIEIAQFIAIPGRDGSVGDLFTNSFGGAAGFAVGRYALIWLRPTGKIAIRLAAGWGVLWLVVQAISSFAFSPSFPISAYYGQLARAFPTLATFRGRILSATIDAVTVPDSRIVNSDETREALQRGATVGALVVPAGPTPKVAPIIRIADAEQNEIVLLAQRSRDLVFGVRTGADVLRLRPPRFAIAEAFPGPGSGPSVTPVHNALLSARFERHAVSMGVQRDSTEASLRVPIKPSLGWTLVLPFQWYLAGTGREFMVTFGWLALWTLPVGYWGTSIVREVRAESIVRARWFVALGIVLLVAAGLVVAPNAFGLPMAPVVDWFAALAGLVAGWTLAQRGRKAVRLAP